MNKKALPNDFEIFYEEDGESSGGPSNSLSQPTACESNEADELFDNLCVDLANDRFWESSTGNVQEDIRSIYRSRPQRIRKRRKKFELDENDPRPHYVDNVVEAYNTGDINKLREVFERQYEPDCVFLQRYTKETPDVPAHREFHHCDQMLDFLQLFLEACPDGILLVSSRKLHIRQDGTSYLVAKLNFNAIWLFNVILRNVLTKTKNLLANFNPLSALYNYFITPTIIQSSVEYGSSTIERFTPIATNNNSQQLPHGPISAASYEEEECIEPEEFKDPNFAHMVQPESSLVTTNSTETHAHDSHVHMDDEGDSYHSQNALSSSSSSSIARMAEMAVEYPSSWLSQSTFFAATQSASAIFPYPWMNPTQTTSSTSSSSQNISITESDFHPIGTSPIEVSTPKTTFSLQPKRQPHRVNLAVSYVAHINGNFKIYKAESFVRGEFSIDWWGKYATRDQENADNNEN